MRSPKSLMKSDVICCFGVCSSLFLLLLWLLLILLLLFVANVGIAVDCSVAVDGSVFLFIDAFSFVSFVVVAALIFGSTIQEN